MGELCEPVWGARASPASLGRQGLFSTLTQTGPVHTRSQSPCSPRPDLDFREGACPPHEGRGSHICNKETHSENSVMEESSNQEAFLEAALFEL